MLTIPKLLLVALFTGIWLLLVGGGSGNQGMAMVGLWLVLGSLLCTVVYRNWLF